LALNVSACTLASGSYRRQCGKHMLVASFSLADPLLPSSGTDEAAYRR